MHCLACSIPTCTRAHLHDAHPAHPRDILVIDVSCMLRGGENALCMVASYNRCRRLSRMREIPTPDIERRPKQSVAHDAVTARCTAL